ncbi:MAG: hypothetical protein ABIV48_08970, partial [Pyrinomonadaceae bacterium]
MIDCPIELERIVHKSLQKNRDERYQVVRELALDLKSLGKELEYSAQYFRRTGEMTNGGLGQTNRERALTEGKTNATTADAGSRYRFSYISAALILGLVAILTLWYFVPGESGSPPATSASSPKSVEVVTWTSSPGEVYSVGSFSPDAKMVAFTSTKTGSKNIWIKQTASGEAIQITKDQFKNEQPIWSPSREELAFFSAKGKQAGFWRMPILGGAPKLITALDDGSARLLFWSEKDQIFYESKNDIFAVSVDSGEKRQITDFASKNIDQRSITLSPDESRVAYTTVEEKNWTLWADSVDGKSQKQLVTAQSQIKNLVWHPDNKRIFYDTVVDGTLQIFVTDISGTPPRQISFVDQDSLVLSISKDGTKLLYGSAKEESDIWGVNLKDSKEFIVASDISSELWPDVSPDGTTLAYQSIKNLSQGNKLLSGDILTRPAKSDSQPSDLIKNGGVPKWSPDGKKVAFIRLTGDKRQIETADPQGGQQKPVTAAGVLSVSNAVLPYLRIHTSDFSWSPDSARIAFVSRQTGQSNLWLAGSEVSDESQLSENTDSDLNIYCPIWNRDGKRIAFTTKTNNAGGHPIYGIRTIDIESKQTSVVTTGNSVLRLLGWSQDESSLILASTESSGTDSSPTEVSL